MVNSKEYYENIEELIEDDFYKLGVDIEDVIEDIIKENGGINVYTFALTPEQYQPSGSCDLSKMPGFTKKNIEGSQQIVFSNMVVYESNMDEVD